MKAEQQDAVKAFVGGKDVFVSVPTGFGKTLCYSLLPLVFDKIRGVTASENGSIVTVVSPFSLSPHPTQDRESITNGLTTSLHVCSLFIVHGRNLV